jgi:hypothetical protein
VDDTILTGAERALACDVDGDGEGEDGVGGDEASGAGGARRVGDGVAALDAGSKDRVDGRKTVRGTLHEILNGGTGEGADGADRGRLIGGNAGLDQVRNGDTGDDENDGDDDEQLDEGKALLPVHKTFLRAVAEATQRGGAESPPLVG